MNERVSDRKRWSEMEESWEIDKWETEEEEKEIGIGLIWIKDCPSSGFKKEKREGKVGGGLKRIGVSWRKKFEFGGDTEDSFFRRGWENWENTNWKVSESMRSGVVGWCCWVIGGEEKEEVGAGRSEEAGCRGIDERKSEKGEGNVEVKRDGSGMSSSEKESEGDRRGGISGDVMGDFEWEVWTRGAGDFGVFGLIGDVGRDFEWVSSSIRFCNCWEGWSWDRSMIESGMMGSVEKEGIGGSGIWGDSVFDSIDSLSIFGEVGVGMCWWISSFERFCFVSGTKLIVLKREKSEKCTRNTIFKHSTLLHLDLHPH
jgi:hypothetical protein